MELEILNAHTSQPYGKLKVPTPDTTIEELRELIHKSLASTPDVHRQSLRLNAHGKSLKSADTLETLGMKNGSKVYIKDLGPQIGWKTVFLVEYIGPFVIYLMFYLHPECVYGQTDSMPISLTAHIAAGCYMFHYVKRLLETLYVHRFSHGTMPLMNLFKNCSYYWCFTAYVAYHVNNPLYKPTSMHIVWGSLATFALCELGNFSIHMALRDLRPAGTKLRKIPVATRNPLTWLFNLVSCPNYTYEIGTWVSFAVMTSCLPAYFFAVAGAFQMTDWAVAKHRQYRKEFKDYPKQRRAIIPFIL